MDWIKDLLKDVVAEEEIEEVVTSFKKEFPKHAVIKSEFNEKLDELKTTKASLDEVNSLVEKLNKEVGSVDEYKTQVETLQSTLKEKETEFNTQLSSIKKRTAYKDLLNKAGVNEAAVDLLVQTADFETIKLNDEGSILESDKLIESLKEKRSLLFNQVKEESNIKDNQNNNDKQKPDSELTMAERFEKMGVKPLNRRYT